MLLVDGILFYIIMTTDRSVLTRLKLDKSKVQVFSFRSWILGFKFCLASHYLHTVLYEKVFSPT